ncbi:ABC transporter ATP-binding protein [Gymnodinialimonas ceratoperidinii]|uniref:ABC transporter ATP-binding protein n=1 Tax=Gymnodinialimonas ceratoperidinii TaxID=2856823 RepID=A0A8F6YDC7_9RHOB|nr:ABC transporter ATP-binding protein [Gymnodinialimonas ceratoperidinii]QXT40057.1 ABC transporter ATP-binding protein [Gymnodinialimonas ceratoperidinii]
MDAPLLDLRDIRKTYPSDRGPLRVLDGVSISLRAGETLALTGESGSGKSTLLHLSGGLDQPDSGEVLLDGRDIGQLDDAARARVRRSRIGLIFQQFNLVPSLTVEKNISLQARLANRHDAPFAAELAGRLGLADLLTRYPEQLSGGQQQRVAIARALVSRPALILADEPTGNLDEDTGDTVLGLLLALVAETGAGLLMVTHSPRLADSLQRRVHLSRGRLEG